LQQQLTAQQLQRNEGIDAVIVDSVLKVRQGLQAPNQDSTNGAVNGASLVVPSEAVPTIKEASEALQNGAESKEAVQQGA
jgi:glycerophosphodiester phosphodiesterase